MKINLHALAAVIAVREGGKQNITIAQIKDVLAALGNHLRALGWRRAFWVCWEIYCRAGRREGKP